MGGIIHVVQLQFKPEVDSKQIDEVCFITTNTRRRYLTRSR